MYVLIILIGVSSQSGTYKVVDTYDLKSKCDKALKYESSQSGDQFVCLPKSGIPSKADGKLRDK